MSLKTLCIILIGAQPFQSQSTTRTTCDGFDSDRQKRKKIQQKIKNGTTKGTMIHKQKKDATN